MTDKLVTPIEIVELRQTCGACPSQWEGRTADGRAIYIRFRWGCLQIGLGSDIDAAVRDSKIVGDQDEDEMLGYLPLSGLIERTEGLYDFNTALKRAIGK